MCHKAGHVATRYSAPEIEALIHASEKVCELGSRKTHAVSKAGFGERSLSQLPAGSDEMTRIAVGIPFQVVLMFGLCLPKIAGLCNFGYNLARPQT